MSVFFCSLFNIKSYLHVYVIYRINQHASINTAILLFPMTYELMLAPWKPSMPFCQFC